MQRAAEVGILIDLDLTGFLLFCALNEFLCRTKFSSTEEVKSTMNK